MLEAEGHLVRQLHRRALGAAAPERDREFFEQVRAEDVLHGQGGRGAQDHEQGLQLPGGADVMFAM